MLNVALKKPVFKDHLWMETMSCFDNPALTKWSKVTSKWRPLVYSELSLRETPGWSFFTGLAIVLNLLFSVSNHQMFKHISAFSICFMLNKHTLTLMLINVEKNNVSLFRWKMVFILWWFLKIFIVVFHCKSGVWDYHW